MKYLFNFAVSYTGGGAKRLKGYSEWFHNNGGASFIIHPNSIRETEKFANNKYFIVKQNKLERLFRDTAYLESIVKKMDIKPQVYFSYGIPIYARVAKINWFHLSNVLPFSKYFTSLGVKKAIELLLLRYRITKHLKNCDIISAESKFGLDQMRYYTSQDKLEKNCILGNGCDKSLMERMTDIEIVNKREDIAVTIGTFSYKRLDDAYQVFLELKKDNEKLKFIIIGHYEHVPKFLKYKNDVVIAGEISQDQVYDYLQKSKFFISSTLIENSSNASLEGVLLSENSYLSDIPANRELLKDINIDLVEFKRLKLKMIRIKSDMFRKNVGNISWDAKIQFMDEYIDRFYHM